MKKGSLRRLWNWLLVVMALIISGFMVIIPLTWQEQAFVGLATLAMIIVLNRISRSQLITITMMALSAIATTRYAYFRITQTVEGMTTAGHGNSINNFFVVVLLFAEMYAFMTLYLGSFPDDTAAAPQTGSAAGRSGQLADGGRLCAHLQRAALCGSAYGAGGAEYRLAGGQDARSTSWTTDGARNSGILPPPPVAATSCAATTSHAKAGNINQALTQDHGRFHRDFRLRSHPHALVPADHHGLVPEGPAAGDDADAAPFLLARSV